MEVFFKPSFVKDFNRLPKDIKREVRDICVNIFPKLENLKDFKKHPFRKIKGFNFYYRMKIGNFRIGLKKLSHQIIFMRVLHRKDIYKHFP